MFLTIIVVGAPFALCADHRADRKKQDDHRHHHHDVDEMLSLDVDTGRPTPDNSGARMGPRNKT